MRRKRPPTSHTRAVNRPPVSSRSGPMSAAADGKTSRPGVAATRRTAAGVPAARRDVALLKSAAALMARQGFHDMSMRDLARATGRSLSGLYYYFSTKEDLLFQIQTHCYTALLEAAQEIATDTARSPQERLIAFIGHHITYFRHNMNEMKVLAHEDLTLGGERGRRLRDIKRAYAGLLGDIVTAHAGVRRPENGPLAPETAAFILFGMMNWLYTWPRRLRMRPAAEIAVEIAQVFLCGFPGCPASDLTDLRATITCPPRAFWPRPGR
ncbi:MAG: TetR/AcrR family transcriptional regulator [Acidobacteriota bacterium]